MLTLSFPEEPNRGPIVLHLEHSLASLSKWESEHKKPFFGKEPKTHEETLSYITCMTQEVVTPTILENLLQVEDYTAISEYINDRQSATWFREDPSAKPSSEIVTSELVYYWMIQFHIPFDPCQDWHFNKLMTLVKVCGIKQSKPKRMSRQAQMEQYRQLNAERKARLGTTG